MESLFCLTNKNGKTSSLVSGIKHGVILPISIHPDLFSMIWTQISANLKMLQMNLWSSNLCNFVLLHLKWLIKELKKTKKICSDPFLLIVIRVLVKTVLAASLKTGLGGHPTMEAPPSFCFTYSFNHKINRVSNVHINLLCSKIIHDHFL